MENNRSISIAELRLLANYFFDNLELNMGIDIVKITKDFYWETLFPEKYNIENEPTELGVGQLSDDLEFLKKILEDKELAVAPNLTHFSALLEFICYNIHFDSQKRLGAE